MTLHFALMREDWSCLSRLNVFGAQIYGLVKTRQRKISEARWVRNLRYTTSQAMRRWGYAQSGLACPAVSNSRPLMCNATATISTLPSISGSPPPPFPSTLSISYPRILPTCAAAAQPAKVDPTIAVPRSRADLARPSSPSTLPSLSPPPPTTTLHHGGIRIRPR
jgi:hypothetical protein